MHRALLVCLCLLAGLLPTHLPAQQPDLARELQEIARRVEEQLLEIDRLLLESGKQGEARDKPKELLRKAKDRHDAATEGIDQLIEKLQSMQKQSSSGSGEPEDGSPPPPQAGGDQQPKGQPQSGKRRENNTPDFQQQPKPKPNPDGKPEPGQEQSQPQANPGSEPKDGKETPQPPGPPQGVPPPEDPTAPGQPGSGEGTWGELREYQSLLKNRGSQPKVPEKFRKYWEAYLKQKGAERK